MRAPKGQQTLSQQIAAYYDEHSERLEPFFSWARARKNSSSETNVDRLVALTRLSRNEVVKLLKDLAEMGLGKFVSGRHGQKSRMQWAYSIQSIGKVALEGGAELQELEDDTSDEADDGVGPNSYEGTIEHTISLSRDRVVVIRTPDNLTQAEAERLAKLMSSLAVGE